MTPEEIAALTDIELLNAIQNWGTEGTESDPNLFHPDSPHYIPHLQKARLLLNNLRDEAVRRMKNNPPVDVPF